MFSILFITLAFSKSIISLIKQRGKIQLYNHSIIPAACEHFNTCVLVSLNAVPHTGNKLTSPPSEVKQDGSSGNSNEKDDGHT